MRAPGRGALRGLAWSIAALTALLAVLAWRMPEVAAWQWYLRAGKPGMADFEPVLRAPLHWVDNYYAVEDLGDGAWAIGEPRYGQCNFSYLIAGSERAVLFDTGPGVRDIGPIVRMLTTLPVLALPSHLHFDHVGNLARFADVALPDLPALRAQARGGRIRLSRYQHLGFVEGSAPVEFAVTRWLAPGSSIDLGGRVLRVLAMPGHTPDSVVLLDSAARRLFAGDFIYPSQIYAFLPGADLAAYGASARELAAQLRTDTVVYGAHGCDDAPAVDVPRLTRNDVQDLARALAGAATSGAPVGAGLYPRQLPVNGRMTLYAKYPWMSR
jgi:glyoxylase-like metal-dependent hydrolase (beta-lactamase superfamily II)